MRQKFLQVSETFNVVKGLTSCVCETALAGDYVTIRLSETTAKRLIDDFEKIKEKGSFLPVLPVQ
jgi:hypothetical protein